MNDRIVLLNGPRDSEDSGVGAGSTVPAASVLEVKGTSPAPTPGLCGCGCGRQTKLGEVVALSKGRSRVEIAEQLGVSRQYVRQILENPPSYLQGHDRGPNVAATLKHRATKLSNKAAKLEGNINSILRRLPERQSYLARKDQGYLRSARTELLFQKIRAFDLRLLAGYAARPKEQSAKLLALLTVKTIPSRNRGGLDPTIEWLREQVGVGWRRDAPAFDPRLVYLEGLDIRGERRSHGDARWWADRQQLDPFEMLQVKAENDAASIMLASSDPVVVKALTDPDALTERERGHLRSVFEVLEQSQMAPTSASGEWFSPLHRMYLNHPPAGGKKKRKRGTGHTHVPGPGAKRNRGQKLPDVRDIPDSWGGYVEMSV